MTSHTVYFNNDYVASEYAFDTTRKSAALAADLTDHAGAEHTDTASLADPGAFTERTVALIDRLHAAAYVEAVRSGQPLALAESQGFEWGAGLPTMATAHATGLVAAVTEVMTTPARVAGSLSSGLHHARRDQGNGFCTFNGLVVAATEALDRGAERVLVIDFDAHCGGGTRSMTSPDRLVQVDVSTIMFDRWIPESPGDVLIPSARGTYLSDITEALRLADAAGSFDLVLYNAGMDPIDSHVTPADLARRELMVAEWAGGGDRRLVYALAGGYTGAGVTMAQLVALHRLTVDAF